MNYVKARIVKLLVDFFEDDYRRIEHALEVLRQAELLAAKHPDRDYEILMAACCLHDVGIKASEALLGYNNGQTQEEYGPELARELLESIGFDQAKTTKVAEIIGNHHSPVRYDYIELAILRQADRIVKRQEAQAG